MVETLILLNLVLVAAVYLEAPQGQAGSAFVVLLTVLPYLYAVGFLMLVAGRKMYVIIISEQHVLYNSVHVLKQIIIITEHILSWANLQRC